MREPFPGEEVRGLVVCRGNANIPDVGASSLARCGLGLGLGLGLVLVLVLGSCCGGKLRCVRGREKRTMHTPEVQIGKFRLNPFLYIDRPSGEAKIRF
jgi:hypothetical protein